MNLLNRWFSKSNTQSLATQPRRSRALQLEQLEAREVLTAKPLPVLMVIANRDFVVNHEAQVAPLDLAAASARQGATVTGSGGTFTLTFNGQSTGGWGASMYQYSFNDPSLGNSAHDEAFMNRNYNHSDYSAIVFVGGWGSSL